MKQSSSKVTPLGALVLARREAMQFTLEDVAQLLKRPDGRPVHFSLVGKVEKGDRIGDADWLLRGFATALDLPLDQLYAAVGRLPPDVAAAAVAAPAPVLAEAFARLRVALGVPPVAWKAARR